MKTKLILLFFLSFLANEMSAVTIRCIPFPRTKYYYVYMQWNLVNCRSAGNISCPYGQVALESATGKEYNGEEVMDYVTRETQSGNKEGSFQMDEGLEVKWTLVDEELNVYTNEKNLRFLTPLDELQKKYNTEEGKY